MPVYDFGFRQWEGERTPVGQRWVPIARTGIRLAWQSKMLKRLMWFAWFPMAYYVFFFFAIGWITDPGNNIANQIAAGGQPSGFQVIFYGIVRGVFGPDVAMTLATDPESLRPVAWSVAFYVFFAFSQGFLSLLIVSIVGPPLISRDLRNRAYLIYFSKPIPVWTYVIGKVSVVAFFMALITVIPAFLLYVLSIAFAPELGAIIDTAPVILRLIAASMVLILPVSLLVLYLSSITDNERTASFSWVAVFVFGEMLYTVLSNQPAFRDQSWVILVSLRHTAMAVVAGIFDVSGQLSTLGESGRETARQLAGWGADSAMIGAIALTALSLFCMRGIVKRVTAPLQI